MSGIIAVFNMKGGVGKSTIAVNLAACAAAEATDRTLLWDIDAQGAATYLLGDDGLSSNARRVFSRDMNPEEAIHGTRWPGLDLLAADISLRDLDHSLAAADKPKRLRKLLKTVREHYGTIVLDVPPGLGEISEQVFRSVDLIVVPVIPTPLAKRSLAQVEEHLEHYHGRKPELLPVVSLVDRRKKMHREFLEAHPSWPAIPQASLVERMAVSRCPIIVSAPRSPAAIAFAELWSAVEHRLSGRQLPTLPPSPGAKKPMLA